MEAKTLVNFAILKNILFKANLSVNLQEIKELAKEMNIHLIKNNEMPFNFDFNEVENYLSAYYPVKDNRFFVGQTYLNDKNFLYMEALSSPVEVYAFRQCINNKLNNKNIVRFINKKIITQVTNKDVLRELTNWRRYSVDSHNKNSDYYYLQEWDNVAKERKNFHDYSIEIDVPIEYDKDFNDEAKLKRDGGCERI